MLPPMSSKALVAAGSKIVKKERETSIIDEIFGNDYKR